MKKLFSLLLLLTLCVGTVWSAPGNNLPGQDLFKELRLSEKGKQLMMEMSKDNGTQPGQTVLHKSVKRNANGSRTVVKITNNNIKWCDYLYFLDENGNEVNYSFNEFPYYYVTLQLATFAENSSDWVDCYNLPLMWPSKSAYFSALGVTMNDNNPTTIEDFTSNPGSFNKFQYVGLHNAPLEVEDGYWPIASPMWANDAYSYIDGEYKPVMYDILDNNSTVQINPSKTGSEVAVEAVMNLRNGETRRYSYDGKSLDLGIKENDFLKIYLIGTPQQWDIEGNVMSLYRDSDESRIYTGRFLIPEGQFMFRFYGKLGDWESYSIGSQDYDQPVNISLNNEYTGNLYYGEKGSAKGKGSWNIESWTGGIVNFTVDLDNSTVTFEKLDYPEILYALGSGNTTALTNEGNGVYYGIFDYTPNMQMAFMDMNGLQIAADRNTSAVFGSTPFLKSIRPFNNYNYWYLQSDNDKTTRVEVTVDLKRMTVTFNDPDHNSISDIKYPKEIIANPYRDCFFDVITNQEINISSDDPDLLTVYELRSEGDVHTFNIWSTKLGETNLRIRTNNGQEVGLIHVISKYVTPESMTLSTTNVTLRQGEFAKIDVKTEPFRYGFYVDGIESNCEIYPELDCIVILATTVGEAEYTARCTENDADISIPFKVTVLPKDASMAEHIVYSYVAPGTTSKFGLDNHKNGSMASATWTSSDSNVAEVDNEGNVTARALGRAVITANCGDHQSMFGINVDNSVSVEEYDTDMLTVYSLGTDIMVAGLPEGKSVDVYAADGSLLLTRKGDGSTLRLPVGIKGAYVVSAFGHSYKVVL